MQIELKNIKHSQWNSEETNCYQATLYIDGKATFQVSNDGRGGCDEIHAAGNKKWKDVASTFEKLTAYCKTLPKCSYDVGNGETKYYDQDIDIVCGDILTKWLIKKDMKKAFRTKIYFIKTPKDKTIFAFKIGKNTKENVITHCSKQFPESIVLNTISEDKALEVWSNN